jgi:hypothetical protein
MNYTKKQPLGEMYPCLQGEGKYIGNALPQASVPA